MSKTVKQTNKLNSAFNQMLQENSQRVNFAPQNHKHPKLIKIFIVLKHLNKKFSEMVNHKMNLLYGFNLTLTQPDKPEV